MLHLVFGVQFELLLWDPLDRKPTTLLPQVGGPVVLMFLPDTLQRNESETFWAHLVWSGLDHRLLSALQVLLPCHADFVLAPYVRTTGIRLESHSMSVHHSSSWCSWWFYLCYRNFHSAEEPSRKTAFESWGFQLQNSLMEVLHSSRNSLHVANSSQVAS